jgi:SAM-dependent methyltransferase
MKELLRQSGPGRAALAAARSFRGVYRYGGFAREFDRFKRMNATSARHMAVEWHDRYPCLDDRTATTGFDAHYTYHPAWAARVLAQTKPKRHVDFSSTLNFCSMVSAFIPTEFYDYRPADLHLPNLAMGRADLGKLPFETGSLESVSCMHVIEHIGLGRYGDPLDPDGDLKAIGELSRVVAPGGTLLIATPVGRERICYNAHRVYDHRKFAAMFSGLTLKEFALIPDEIGAEGMLVAPDPAVVDRQEYACGCYWFTK